MERHRTSDQRRACLLAVQIFTKNASTWKERTFPDKDIRLFDEARQKTGIQHIASHTSYLINLASPEKKKYAMSCEALKQELIRCEVLETPKGKSEKDWDQVNLTKLRGFLR